LPLRLEADVLRAAVDGGVGALDAALTIGEETGWVSPFLGLPAPAAAMLSAAPVERRHPALASARTPSRSTHPTLPSSEPVEPLTRRELEVLAFLPTHLSYAQIAERVYLSVNTVKTTLKSVYRKLHAASRAEAVESARRAGLL
jgi:LuxR family maltose regulon positive regulatory protein